VDDYRLMPTAASRRALVSPAKGYLAAFRADLIGRAAMALGAGRQRVEDTVDHAAGIVLLKKPGEAVEAGQPVLELHYNADRGLDEAVALAQQSIEVSATPPAPPPLVLGRVA
jgi:pyrimidine-nucleoside phosphorylase/thymidine phosphorylase